MKQMVRQLTIGREMALYQKDHLQLVSSYGDKVISDFLKLIDDTYANIKSLPKTKGWVRISVIRVFIG